LQWRREEFQLEDWSRFGAEIWILSASELHLWVTESEEISGETFGILFEEGTREASVPGTLSSGHWPSSLVYQWWDSFFFLSLFLSPVLTLALQFWFCICLTDPAREKKKLKLCVQTPPQHPLLFCSLWWSGSFYFLLIQMLVARFMPAFYTPVAYLLDLGKGVSILFQRRRPSIFFLNCRKDLSWIYYDLYASVSTARLNVTPLSANRKRAD
jgi:hypothetical protein